MFLLVDNSFSQTSVTLQPAPPFICNVDNLCKVTITNPGAIVSENKNVKAIISYRKKVDDKRPSNFKNRVCKLLDVMIHKTFYSPEIYMLNDINPSKTDKLVVVVKNVIVLTAIVMIASAIKIFYLLNIKITNDLHKLN